MNPIKAFINMLKSDIKTVITTAKRIKEGKPILNPQKVAELKREISGITFQSYLQENWLWIMTIIFAAVMTWVMAANYYSIQANNFIIQNCRPEVLSGYFGDSYNFSDLIINATKAVKP